MRSELSYLLNEVRAIRDTYEKNGVSEYMEDWDSELFSNILDLIEALNEYESVVENDDWHEY